MTSELNNCALICKCKDKIYYFSLTCLSDGEEYAINFKFKGGRNAILSIYLDQYFPESKPKIKINPIVQHIFVNSQGELIAPALLNVSLYFIICVYINLQVQGYIYCIFCSLELFGP